MENKIAPNALKWTHTAEEITALTTQIIEESTKTLDGVANLEGPRTYDNTIEPIVNFEAALSTRCNNLTFYRYVSMNKELRDQSLAAEEKFDEFDIKIWMREDLYKAIDGFKTEA